MIIHISLFYLKDRSSVPAVVDALKRVPSANSDILDSRVGENFSFPPPAPGLPAFADAAQVITFPGREEAASYPSSDAHMNLMREIGGLVDHVAAAEFEA